MSLDDFTLDELRNGFLGTVLADGCVSKIRNRYKNSCFEVTHTSKNIDYLKFKQEILKRLGIDSTLTPHNKRIEDKEYFLIRLYARTSEWFTELRRELYDDKGIKHLPESYLRKLNLLSLFLMYLDDGTLKIRYYEGTSRIREIRVTLCLDRFTIRELLPFRDWLKETFGVDTKYYRHSRRMEPGRGFRLWTNTENTKKLMSLIDSFYNSIPSMNYKFVRYYSM